MVAATQLQHRKSLVVQMPFAEAFRKIPLDGVAAAPTRAGSPNFPDTGGVPGGGYVPGVCASEGIEAASSPIAGTSNAPFLMFRRLKYAAAVVAVISGPLRLAASNPTEV